MAQQDISGFNSTVTLTASRTFPLGFQVNQFADDTDPIEAASIDIADKAMGLNGDLIVWAKGTPLPLALAVIVGSPSDISLQILADANRVGPGKPSAADIIQAAVVMPNGVTTIYSNGRLTNAMFGRSVASSGRQKTRVYMFAFEGKTGG